MFKLFVSDYYSFRNIIFKRDHSIPFEVVFFKNKVSIVLIGIGNIIIILNNSTIITNTNSGDSEYSMAGNYIPVLTEYSYS